MFHLIWNNVPPNMEQQSQQNVAWRELKKRSLMDRLWAYGKHVARW